jgi:hypothetical protein
MIKLSADDSKRISAILGRLDKIAETIQENHGAWGMPFEQAKPMVNEVDGIADEIESMTFGEGSLQTRQMEVLASDKQAEVLQRDGDESYMNTFEKGVVVQQDADEPYMSAYADDESSGVRHGQSTTGRPLAP